MTDLEKKIEETEQELLENPEINKEVNEILKGFRKFCKDFPEQINRWKKLINSNKK